MSALGNRLYLDTVKHAALWDEYNLLSEPKEKKAKARDIAFLVPNDVERELYNQFRALLTPETIPRIPVEYGGFAIQRLDSELVHVFFHDEDGILIDYRENVDPADAFTVFEEMVLAESAAGFREPVEPRETRKTRKQNRKR